MDIYNKIAMVVRLSLAAAEINYKQAKEDYSRLLWDDWRDPAVVDAFMQAADYMDLYERVWGA